LSVIDDVALLDKATSKDIAQTRIVLDDQETHNVRSCL